VSLFASTGRVLMQRPLPRGGLLGAGPGAGRQAASTTLRGLRGWLLGAAQVETVDAAPLPLSNSALSPP
jgi:hypothetical protein